MFNREYFFYQRARIIFILITSFFLNINYISAQQKIQNIRGIVVDKETQKPLHEVAVVVTSTTPTLGTITNEKGKFRVPNVPVGRQTIEFSYLGYQTVVLKNINITSGKELVLKIELIESMQLLDEVTITKKKNRFKSLNVMATNSVQTFSVEQTMRYAVSLSDPARMVQSFAGVAGSGDDIGNEIVIRGNSPRGILWRLEGVDIPNPNHFSSPAGSGGGVSMMSANTLSTSEFYTGAFPAEYGNALAGVFDIHLRTGNNENSEYSFMLGALGTEISLEGPISKKSEASYLINYRYSTLAILKPFLGDFLGDFTPQYQDLTLKIHVPTNKLGDFTIFGLTGSNDVSNYAIKDITQWKESSDDENYFEKNHLTIMGFSHFYRWKNTYLKTTLAYTTDLYKDRFSVLLPLQNYKDDLKFKNIFENKTFKAQFLVNTKLNKNHTIKFGGVLSNLQYHLLGEEKNEQTDLMDIFFNNKGHTNLYQSYANWKWRFSNNFTLFSGVHTAYLSLNSTYSIDPRIALQYKPAKNKLISLSVGKHSQHQHPSSYFIEKTNANGHREMPNLNLEFTKALHFVLAYQQQFNSAWNFKTELYYQSLFDVPIEKDSQSISSLINSVDIWDIYAINQVNNQGTGYNLGLDFTLEKSFSKGYYSLITASVYNSKYTPANGVSYNTRYNGNYLFNALYGREWTIGENNNLFSINGKFSLRGGNRYSEINKEKSIQQGQTYIIKDNAFEKQYPNYSRVDFGLKYSINKKRATHAFSIDLQNVFNRKNIRSIDFDLDTNTLRTTYQSGLIPNFNYRITF